MKKIKNLLKKIGKAYLEGAKEYYKPFIETGVSPFI